MSDTIQVNEIKLDRLRNHLKNGGSHQEAEISKLIKVSSSQILKAYMDEAKKRWPELLSPEQEETKDEPNIERGEPTPEQVEKDVKAAAPKPVSTPAESASKTFYLKGDDGVTVTELEVDRETPSKIFLKRKVEREEVQILVKGQAATVDLNALRQMEPNHIVQPHGVAAYQLIALAELAKG